MSSDDRARRKHVADTLYALGHWVENGSAHTWMLTQVETAISPLGRLVDQLGREMRRRRIGEAATVSTDKEATL